MTARRNRQRVSSSRARPAFARRQRRMRSRGGTSTLKDAVILIVGLVAMILVLWVIVMVWGN